MVWRRSYSREEVKELLASIDERARDAIAAGERAQREMAADRFSTYLDFRKKVEELRAVTALTEERLSGLEDATLRDLKVEFERLDLVMSGMIVRTMKNYFGSIREDQVLPLGARELFEPELSVLEELRAKLTRPQYEGQTPGSSVSDIEDTMAIIKKLVARAPSLPDFSDAPSPSRPVKRLSQLTRPIR
jgi:hypothetical protein